MNIVEAFADWLTDHQLIDATLGQNLFISKLSPKAPDTSWRLRLESPGQGRRTVTGELQQPVTISVYLRSKSSKTVYDSLQLLNAEVNSAETLNLNGFTVSGVSTSGPFIDQDIDDNERDLGLLQVTLNTYKENSYVIS